MMKLLDLIYYANNDNLRKQFPKIFCIVCWNPLEYPVKCPSCETFSCNKCLLEGNITICCEASVTPNKSSLNGEGKIGEILGSLYVYFPGESSNLKNANICQRKDYPEKLEEYLKRIKTLSEEKKEVPPQPIQEKIIIDDKKEVVNEESSMKPMMDKICQRISSLEMMSKTHDDRIELISNKTAKNEWDLRLMENDKVKNLNEKITILENENRTLREGVDKMDKKYEDLLKKYDDLCERTNNLGHENELISTILRNLSKKIN